MANPSITCRPSETARAFRGYDEDDSTVLAGIDGSRAPVHRMPRLAEVHEQPLDRGLKALRGRRTECETLDHLLESARGEQSAALVVRGEPGIGKTALLEYAIDSASDLSVVRAAAVESEIELPFAGLHQLCVPVLDRLACLPAPQRHALETVFGLGTGSPPDRFFVGLAVLSLISAAAEAGPPFFVGGDVEGVGSGAGQGLGVVGRPVL